MGIAKRKGRFEGGRFVFVIASAKDAGFMYWVVMFSLLQYRRFVAHPAASLPCIEPYF